MNELREREDHEFIGDDAELVQLVGLKLGEEEYAIDVLKIQEIIRTAEITIVPRVDSFILGVMNLRGKVIPVIDLRVRFSLDRCDFDKATRFIVIRFEKQNIGFVVDEVTEVIRIRKSMVEPTPPLVGSIGQEYILGICKYDSRLIMLLDIDRVLNESGEQMESELRKKMLGPSTKGKPALLAIEEEIVEEEVVEEVVVEEKKAAPIVEESNDLPKPEEVPSPIITKIEEPVVHEEEHHDDDHHESADAGIESDIDALIARELAMREAETEELNKKKRKSERQSNEEVLADALAQSSAIFELPNSEELHVSDGDLNSLITNDLSTKEEKSTQKKEEPVSSSATSNVSIKELKSIADKIISGEEPEGLNVDIKGEIGELLRLIIDTKSKVDEINPVITTSQEAIPSVASALEEVNDTTEKATLNLMDASNSMSAFYKKFIDDLKNLKKLANKENEKEFFELYTKTCDNLSNAEELGFKILEALEFQDITEQKLRKVIKSIEDMGARIGAIVGFLQVHQPNSDKWAEKLLEDYGLA